MKVLKRVLLLCLLFLITGSLTGTGRAAAQPGVSVSFQAFYNELAPYGRWVENRDYGRVWIPAVEAGFQPYGTRGHWVVTEYGNTWVSDYEWGWAPFHYGRWVFDDYYGWIWVPGEEWGPAWVTWRSGGGYYGWAPLSPGLDINININIPVLRWIFVPQRYITSHSVYSYCIPHRHSVNIYRSTTVINNIYVNNNRRYFYGPRPHEIERVTRSRVRVHHIDNMDRPGRAMASNGSLRLYRPEIRDGRSSVRETGRPSAYRDRNRDYRPSAPGNSRPDRVRPDTRNAYPENQRDDRRNNPAADNNNMAPNRETQRPAREARPSQPFPDQNNGNVERGERYQRPVRTAPRPESSGEERNNVDRRREETPQRLNTPSRPERPERSRTQGGSRDSESRRPAGDRPSRSSGRSV